MDDALDVLFLALIFVLSLSIVGADFLLSRDCAAGGGHYVRTLSFSGYECLK